MATPIAKRLVESSPHRLLRRIGRCIQFGCPPTELVRAVDLVRSVQSAQSRASGQGSRLFTPVLRLDSAQGSVKGAGTVDAGLGREGDLVEILGRAARGARAGLVGEVLGRGGPGIEVRVLGTDIRPLFVS